ncbi:nitric oxide reductase transcriptional regulator NorR [Shewanella sp. 10N.286.48.B5]|uniref:nitric oxide reductase transcriptional regulator NorR n=1 Tax=Shewanella sp. 10N.286.48.B5 TaxID=1880834 RepID=UPI000C83F3F4|nr:nitric oxide reductase transcriptional regulator NorR [Shewanella sp. 10N.286.48.B5]PMH85459.1 nitric oxide reductase transcription regulator [Shewanella sp. 10N.286.48.B5]
MDQYKNDWIQVALDISSSISEQDRFERLLATIQSQLKCDAAALLLFKGQQFIPLAINGLTEDVLGRRFEIEQHPRLEAIARAGDIVRFPPDSDLPDPYDGLIPNHDEMLHVHSCIGLPLIQQGRLIGAVTIDAFDPHQFDDFQDSDLRLISALAANSLHTALLVEKLESNIDVINSEKPQSFSASHHEMIGKSKGMQALKSHIEAVAQTDLSVLIMGETGVGKELVAHAVFEKSTRSTQPFIYLNCAALPESVAESELFGHVKGAFTGAISHRKGKFELANNGTLFLDEVGELSLALQAKLLRALQYGDIQRVGDDNNIKVDVRIIAATNRIMHEEVKAGHFRSDLYHRLSVFPLFVPPLRERGKDIILLAGFFAERCQHKLNVASIKLDTQVLALLQQTQWEGNVRELEHALNRAAVLAKAETNSTHLILKPHHFNLLQTTQLMFSEDESSNASTQVTKPSLSQQSFESQKGFEPYVHMDLKNATELFQTKLIQQTYVANNEKLTNTANALGLSPGNLHRLMKRLNLK